VQIPADEAKTNGKGESPRFLSDEPAIENNALRFDRIVSVIRQQIDHYTEDFRAIACGKKPKREIGALTLGIEGEWGQGKTSLLRQIEKNYEDQKAVWSRHIPKNPWKHCDDEELSSRLWKPIRFLFCKKQRHRYVWVNPWKHHDRESVRAALIWKVVAAFPRTLLFRVLHREAVGLAWGIIILIFFITALISVVIMVFVAVAIEAANLGVLISSGFVGVMVSLVCSYMMLSGRLLLKILLHSDINGNKQFETSFRHVITKHTRKHPGSIRHLILVFLDDLDRCEPDVAMEVLGVIKQYLDIPGCVFLSAYDPKKVELLIGERFTGIMLEEEWVNADTNEQKNQTSTKDWPRVPTEDLHEHHSPAAP